MPIYEYQCESCDHEFEALQKLSDDKLTDCPECKKSSLRKKISAVAFRLKGSGWYETDFKTGDKKNVAGDKPASTSSGDAKSKAGSSKTESKKSDSKASTTKTSEGSSKTSSASKKGGGS